MRLAPDSPTRKELPPERPNDPMITIEKPARGEKWMIELGATEPKDASRSPLVQRFFHSFKLLTVK
jgi:hypothetical protein